MRMRASAWVGGGGGGGVGWALTLRSTYLHGQLGSLGLDTYTLDYLLIPVPSLFRVHMENELESNHVVQRVSECTYFHRFETANFGLHATYSF